MIKANIKSTGWAVDKPKETIVEIPEDLVAFEQTNNNGSKTPVTFGELYKVYSERKTYVKVNAGYDSTNIKPETFEKWFYRAFVPKEIYDRLISVKYEIV